MAGITLEEVLEAREARARRQQELLREYGCPLISFTMNIAGPEKTGPLIRRGFRLGLRLLDGQLARVGAAVLHRETQDRVTGCEAMYAVAYPAAALKELCCGVEDNSPLGRLFDLDVLRSDGAKLERTKPRRCLLCGRPAADCSRSRRHTVEQLRTRTRELLEDALARRDARTVASLACRALLYEACTAPKPGLVDRFNNGSHRDMDLFTFMSSAAALEPYFADCVRVGQRTAERPAPETLAALRWPGKLAEGEMLAATGGVNTHKGAIFSLGLVCGALGRLDPAHWADPEQVLGQVSAMAAGIVDRELGSLEPDAAATAGERFYLAGGVRGVRGQAEDGFPAVLRFGLPILEQGVAQGKSLEEAGAAAMLWLLANSTDTNLIARGGEAAQRGCVQALRNMLPAAPYPERSVLEALDREYTEKNLSPGGSADQLALTYLLYFLRQEGNA